MESLGCCVLWFSALGAAGLEAPVPCSILSCAGMWQCWALGHTNPSHGPCTKGVFAPYLGLCCFMRLTALPRVPSCCEMSCAQEEQGFVRAGTGKVSCNKGSVQGSPQSCRQRPSKSSSASLASDSPDCLFDTFFPPSFHLLSFSSIRTFVVC